jgi:hypothetical protein
MPRQRATALEKRRAEIAASRDIPGDHPCPEA